MTSSHESQGTEPAVAADRPSAPFHLFVYGTLMSPTVFRAVLGRRLSVLPTDVQDDPSVALAREAVLPGYTKVSPDNAYLYAVPDPQGRIRGYCVGPLEPECMDALEQYEGRNYRRVEVEVRTASDAVRAYAFVGDEAQMSHTFGYEFRDHLKQEVLLREKIDAILGELQRALGREDTEVDRRALAELHGQTIRDLMRQHFESAGISNFYIRQALEGRQLRDYQRILSQPRAAELSYPYLALVIRQVLFNEIEERIRTDFRYDLDRMRISNRFYERTVSTLATLRLLNEQPALLEMLAADALVDVRFDSQHHLIDFIRWAVSAADAVYNPAEAHAHIRYVRTHMGRGSIPLGAEVEFSNTGHWVIAQPEGLEAVDPVYQGFQYFSDFGLDILMWKLGGHVDDHREKVSDRPKRGFLELAFGNLSIAANLSKPITDDPWLLNQLIHETMRFYPVRPHSVHISLQLPHDQPYEPDRALPPAVMRCLFAMLGDPRRCLDGKVRLVRLTGSEIVTRGQAPAMLFSAIARRRSEGGEDGYDPDARRGPLVQQFKFLRLAPRINYEPVAVALKGLQIRYGPGNFLTAGQYRRSASLRQLWHDLLDWGDAPTPLPAAEIDDFLAAVHDGLARERHGQPAHGEAYIGFCLDHLRTELERFNAMLAASQA